MSVGEIDGKLLTVCYVHVRYPDTLQLMYSKVAESPRSSHISQYTGTHLDVKHPFPREATRCTAYRICSSLNSIARVHLFGGAAHGGLPPARYLNQYPDRLNDGDGKEDA